MPACGGSSTLLNHWSQLQPKGRSTDLINRRALRGQPQAYRKEEGGPLSHLAGEPDAAAHSSAERLADAQAQPSSACGKKNVKMKTEKKHEFWALKRVKYGRGVRCSARLPPHFNPDLGHLELRWSRKRTPYSTCKALIIES